MSHTKLVVILNSDEKEALFNLARSEARDPRFQGGLLIRQKLQDMGLLSDKMNFYKKLYEKDGFMKDGRNTETI